MDGETSLAIVLAFLSGGGLGHLLTLKYTRDKDERDRADKRRAELRPLYEDTMRFFNELQDDMYDLSEDLWSSPESMKNYGKRASDLATRWQTEGEGQLAERLRQVKMLTVQYEVFYDASLVDDELKRSEWIADFVAQILPATAEARKVFEKPDVSYKFKSGKRVLDDGTTAKE